MWARDVVCMCSCTCLCIFHSQFFEGLGLLRSSFNAYFNFKWSKSSSSALLSPLPSSSPPPIICLIRSPPPWPFPWLLQAGSASVTIQPLWAHLSWMPVPLPLLPSFTKCPAAKGHWVFHAPDFAAFSKLPPSGLHLHQIPWWHGYSRGGGRCSGLSILVVL